MGIVGKPGNGISIKKLKPGIDVEAAVGKNFTTDRTHRRHALRAPAGEFGSISSAGGGDDTEVGVALHSDKFKIGPMSSIEDDLPLVFVVKFVLHLFRVGPCKTNK